MYFMYCMFNMAQVANFRGGSRNSSRVVQGPIFKMTSKKKNLGGGGGSEYRYSKKPGL